MAERKIIVRVDLETAECRVEAEGYNGFGCKDASRPYEDALGIVTDRTAKREMHANGASENHVQGWRK